MSVRGNRLATAVVASTRLQPGQEQGPLFYMYMHSVYMYMYVAR